MAESYFSASHARRREALLKAQFAAGNTEHLMEKDVWVVWCLETLFGSQFKFAPEIVGDAPDALPPSRSQESKWTKEIRKKLDEWVEQTAAPFIESEFLQVEPEGEVIVNGHDIVIRYVHLTEASISGYVSPEVKLEFGARSTGEPNQVIPVTCDAASYVNEIAFPTAHPNVMAAERIFLSRRTKTGKKLTILLQ